MSIARALFLSRVTASLPEGFDRLYCGAEFCPWLFPSEAELETALTAARVAKLPFTLVTPVIAEAFLPRLRQRLEKILPALQAGDELVISDWGGLAMARAIAPQLPIILGRALSSQKRGPQILDLELSPAQLDYFQQSAWSSFEARALLAEVGISRIELDLPPQGLAPLPEGLSGSLHTPFAMVASSRNCPFREGPGDRGCAATCGETFTLTTPQSRLPLLQCGNTQFLRNDTLPPDLPALGIDRLVIHPHLPR